MKAIENRASFNFIRYSNVWEDADLLCRALKPMAKGRRLLSIASAGDNALALLSLDPKELIAADLNPAQLACLEIRLAAFQSLDHGALLRFMGVSEEPRRLEQYARLRGRLSGQTREFWDGKEKEIRSGIIHAGRLERFLRRYRWALERFVHPPARIQTLLQPADASSRRSYYDQTFNSPSWRLLNRVAFSRSVLGRLGRDPEFFRHASPDVTSGPAERMQRALTGVQAHSNPYLSFQLTGNYRSGALPLYLRPENFKAIRSRSGRVQLFLGQVEEAPGSFAGFNLSNVFEYMDSAQHLLAYGRILDKAALGGRLAYWNLHVQRARPESEKRRARELAAGLKLGKNDQYWAYRSFHLDERFR